MRMKKILVPIDGSDYSIRALDRAKELGEFYKAKITVLTVIDIERFFVGAGSFENELVEDGQELLAKSEKILGDYPYGFETVYKKGNKANEIIKMAEENNFDLIVIGSRGLGGFTRALLGGVSQKVVSHADTTVMVVK